MRRLVLLVLMLLTVCGCPFLAALMSSGSDTCANHCGVGKREPCSNNPKATCCRGCYRGCGLILGE